MADYDQRPRGGRGGYGNRKRRYRGDSRSIPTTVLRKADYSK